MLWAATGPALSMVGACLLHHKQPWRQLIADCSAFENKEKVEEQIGNDWSRRRIFTGQIFNPGSASLPSDTESAGLGTGSDDPGGDPLCCFLHCKYSPGLAALSLFYEESSASSPLGTT